MSESRLKIRNIHSEDYKAIAKILEDVEWPRRPWITDQDLFEEFLNNQDRSMVALESSRVVGVAAAVCNEISIGYVTLFAVAPDKHRLGIGEKLAKALIDNDPHMKWVLSSAPKSVGFWEKQGFVFAPNMMVRDREIQINSQEETVVRGKPKFKEIFRNLMNKIYRLNLYQCQQLIERLIYKILK